MRKNTSVTLGSHFEQFIARQIAEGRFGSASEVIRAGLRILEQQETQLLALRRSLEDGEASGHAEYSLQDLIDELDRDNAS